jgi:hypothetical protein
MTTDTERDRAEEAARRMRLRARWRDHHLEQAAFWRHYGAKQAAHHEARAA